MPSNNIIRNFAPNYYYHVYNRGVEKRQIFLDQQDLNTLLYYLKLYLAPIEELKLLNLSGIRISRFIKNSLSTEIDLLSFSLMPNHIHLLLKQYTKDGITKLMRRITTAYVMYFNDKYERVGSLFQNRFKAVSILDDAYLLHLSRYIHLNPEQLHSNIDFKKYTSFPYYIGKKKASWVKPDFILSLFEKSDIKQQYVGYKKFVEDYREEFCIPKDLLIEQ